jgi:hypothetical protein
MFCDAFDIVDALFTFVLVICFSLNRGAPGSIIITSALATTTRRHINREDINKNHL